MSPRVTRIEAERIYGRLSFVLEFGPRINIVYGRNGSGKTTLLHILANVVNEDFDRFCYLPFSRIRVFFDGKPPVELVSDKHGPALAESDPSGRMRLRRLCKGHGGSGAHRLTLEEHYVSLRTLFSTPWGAGLEEGVNLVDTRSAYFPAFRTMIEAWSSSLRHTETVWSFVHSQRSAGARKESTLPERVRRLTALARRAFGPFVPVVNYPSLHDIERELAREVRAALYKEAKAYEEILTDAFVKAFAVVVGGSDAIDDLDEAEAEAALEQIGRLLEEIAADERHFGGDAMQRRVYDELKAILGRRTRGLASATAARVLSVYRSALAKQRQVQMKTRQDINTYLEAVNEFLEDKKLVVGRTKDDVEVSVEFADGGRDSLQSLSSGERQIATMLYAATHGSETEYLVLIDEPEISLHIDWQRRLIEKMAEHLGDRQIIVCTHSPEIGVEYDEWFVELEPRLEPG